MKRYLLYALLFIFVSQSLFSQSYLPKSGGEVVEHSHYTLSYSEEHEQAEWVYYTLSPAKLAVNVSRSDNFREDSKVSTQSAALADYAGSGYDRGHLAPAASMSYNTTAMSESFFLSNMSPQHPSFNRGAWKRLEERVRELASTDSILHVVTGPIFTDPLGAIGANEVTVPRYYYKVLFSPKKGAMVGFVMENKKLDGAIESYATTVDHIEALSGVNFFAEFDAEFESYESTINLRRWTVPTTMPQSPKVVAQPVESGQCQGKTAAGKLCSRKAQSGSNFCWQHQQ